MTRPLTPITRAFAALITVGLLGGTPAPVLAADPLPVAWPVPAALPTAPITLADGTVLPLPPPEMTQRESVQAEMAAEYAEADLNFAPGGTPTVPLALPATQLAPGLPAAQTPGLAGPSAVGGITPAALPNGLRKEVFGFLPYWMLDATDLQWMQYQLVSTIAFFGVAAKPDGTLATYATGWTAWYSAAMTNVINAAHARGVKVVLTVTMMAYDGGAQQASLLASATARTNVIAAIVAAVRDRQADGVNLDFEPVAVAQRDQYTSFVRQLKAALVAAGVGSHVSVCTMAGAASWATGYDLAGLVAPGAADALFVMGYDYSWSGSARAGGVAPMDSPYILDVNESVAAYLRVVPASKIIWGVPYYGRSWQTQSNALNAPTKAGASGASVAYWYTANVSLATQYGRLWDGVGKVPWFRYYDAGAVTWVQGYYDDAVSLAAKWDMVNQRGLLGTGMWTLLMDAGHQELWNLLAAKFVNDTSPPIGGITVLPPMTDAAAIPVSWRLIDVGSGLVNQSVQYRDRANGAWNTWLVDTPATSAFFVGQPGHSYEFRVSAIDRNGNRQLWTTSPPDPGASLTNGGFAEVATDGLNVRSGAGTSFGAQAQLARGERVAILAGPIQANGFDWYQVQYGFAEWPSADYPIVGWSAASGGGVPYLVPAVAPTVTTLAPAITGYSASPRRFSPNGDGALDSVSASFSLATPATAARLDVLSSGGAIVASRALGPLPAGAQSATWDGRLTDGSWAPGDTYLVRVVVTDATGEHFAPAAGVDISVLATWGVLASLGPPGATYIPLSPARLVDTRSGTGLSGPFRAGVPRTFQVSGQGGVPLTAVAVTGTLTITNQAAAGYVSLGPDPVATPTTSTLNFPMGDTRATGVTVALSSTGTLSATISPVGSAQLVFDVTGYFVPDGSGATYIPLSPARLVDTRSGTGLSGPFRAGVPRTFQVSGQGGVPLTAVAVTGTLTITNQAAAGYVSLGPDPVATPTTSTLNFPMGDTRATGVTVALSSTGTLSATISPVGSAQLVFDVTGYFVPDGSGATYIPLSPARLVDTRSGTGLSGPFRAGVPRTFQVSGQGGVPLTAVAVTGTLTITNQAAAGYVSLGPDPVATPTTSTLNFPMGDTRATGVTVAVGRGGCMSATSGSVSGATTDLLFDLAGYFVP